MRKRWSASQVSVLLSLPVIELVRATGLSYSYCNHIKNGRMVPHARWWEVLRRAFPIEG